MKEKDPYAALRFREFNLFLIMRFAMVFAWSMQFVIIEWEVYSLTKDPLSLGIIGLMEIIPAVSMALFAGHIVDQSEKKKLLIKCIFGFSLVSLGLFLVTLPSIQTSFSMNEILYMVYALVFLGGFFCVVGRRICGSRLIRWRVWCGQSFRWIRCRVMRLCLWVRR